MATIRSRAIPAQIVYICMCILQQILQSISARVLEYDTYNASVDNEISANRNQKTSRPI